MSINFKKETAMKKRMELIFLTMILLFASILGYNMLKNYQFKHTDLPESYKEKITQREQKILSNMQTNLGFRYKFPLIVTDRIPGRLYGLTTLNDGKIKIYLNKKVMQESFDYIIDEVIAHEYAHAVLMQLGYIDEVKAGHSKRWEKVCKALGGKECRQYVNQKEIIMAKMPF